VGGGIYELPSGKGRALVKIGNLLRQPQRNRRPTRVDGVRAHMTNQWNTNVQRDFRFKEGVVLQLRVNAINLQNRTQFAAPTSQSNTTKRFIQVQARLRF
jgi:hypothetical protein